MLGPGHVLRPVAQAEHHKNPMQLLIPLVSQGAQEQLEGGGFPRWRPDARQRIRRLGVQLIVVENLLE